MSPMFPAFSDTFDLNNTQLLLITGVCILSFAYVNLIIVPCANIFGRRFVFIAFLSLSVASYVWEALASSYTSFIVARVVNGAGAAVYETVPMQTVADLFFLYERGRWTVAFLYVGRLTKHKGYSADKTIIVPRPRLALSSGRSSQGISHKGTVFPSHLDPSRSVGIGVTLNA